MKYGKPLDPHWLIEKALSDIERSGVTYLGRIETPNGADRVYMHRDGLPRVSKNGRGELLNLEA